MTEEERLAMYAESLKAAETDMQNQSSPSGSGAAPIKPKRNPKDIPEEVAGWRTACKAAERFIRKGMTCEDWQIDGTQKRFTALSGGGPFHEALYQAAAVYVRYLRAERLKLAAAEDDGAEQLEVVQADP